MPCFGFAYGHLVPKLYLKFFCTQDIAVVPGMQPGVNLG